MKDNCKDPKCMHEKRYHAIPEKHILGTSHCTAIGCKCTHYEPEVE